MENVILPVVITMGNGVFIIKEISLEEAKKWVETKPYKNYCWDDGVKLLGLEPVYDNLLTFEGYDEALCVFPRAAPLNIETGQLSPHQYEFKLVTYVPSEKALNFINNALMEAVEYGANDNPSPLLDAIEDIKRDRLEF